jgi:hypothetical protein
MNQRATVEKGPEGREVEVRVQVEDIDPSHLLLPTVRSSFKLMHALCCVQRCGILGYWVEVVGSVKGERGKGSAREVKQNFESPRGK